MQKAQNMQPRQVLTDHPSHLLIITRGYKAGIYPSKNLEFRLRVWTISFLGQTPAACCAAPTIKAQLMLGGELDTHLVEPAG